MLGNQKPKRDMQNSTGSDILAQLSSLAVKPVLLYAQRRLAHCSSEKNLILRPARNISNVKTQLKYGHTDS